MVGVQYPRFPHIPLDFPDIGASFREGFGTGYDRQRTMDANTRNDQFEKDAPDLFGKGLDALYGGGGGSPMSLAALDPSGGQPPIDRASARVAQAFGEAPTAPGDAEKTAMAFFTSKGYSPHQAAGIVGNLIQESNLRTGAINRGDGADGSNSIGVGQWNGDRARAFRAFAQQNGADPNDLTTQLAFVDHELKTTERAAGDRLRQANDPISAASAFIGYERPQGWSAENPTGGHGWSNRARNAARLAGSAYAPAAAEASGPVQVADASGAFPAGATASPDSILPPRDVMVQLFRNPQTRDLAVGLAKAGLALRQDASDPMKQLEYRKSLLGLQTMLQGKPAEAFTLSPGQVRYGADGKQIAAGPPKGDSAIEIGADGSITIGSNLGTLTEGQSKDVNFYTRGTAQLPLIEQFEETMVSAEQAAKSGVPLVGNFLTSPEYQQGQQAGREFLAAILRKDTGAAVTNQEFELYGPMFLPVPGDGVDVLDQKRVARARAMDAIRTGLGGKGDALPPVPKVTPRVKAAPKVTPPNGKGVGGDDLSTMPPPAGTEEWWKFVPAEKRKLWRQ